MNNRSYKEFSQIYDILMNDIDYEKWTSFITEKIEGSKVLEAACGTGNITRLLADKNFKVTAFDLSQDMLMRAYEKLGRNKKVKLLNMDMTEFKIDDKFDAAICCCDGVNYINKKELKEFFQNIYNHLDNNSRFIFDFSTQYKYETMFNDTYVYDDGEIFYVWENLHDESDDTVNMEINFFIKDASDKYNRINEIQTQYIHKSEEMVSLLNEIGFKKIKIYDDYNNEQINDNSLRAVFVCEKGN
ncbi:class I SAM-dependent methyltransferase [Sedimentibacter sp.]|uniref:class I SAM-dependent DNA methyltransferase n=1 Tax=Sedimentibacter sp. TaxID=1960295 RepID=UPI0028A999F3|nr:class I SAM-dependent methyltransferase [Sedimentibacter sp.]